MHTPTQTRDHHNELTPHPQQSDHNLDQEGSLAHDEGYVQDKDLQRLQRRCIATGKMHLKSELLRFVISPDHDLVFDLKQNLPGRGVWLTPCNVLFEKALTKGLFKKAAASKLSIRDDLYDHVCHLIRDSLINTLCLANRASMIAAGADQCLDVLRASQAGLYLTSSAKDSEMRQRIESKNPKLIVIDYLSDTELGRIVGRPELTHMIAKRGNLCLKGEHLHHMLQKMKR